jgi:mRNA interferase RelE/StbE
MYKTIVFKKADKYYQKLDDERARRVNNAIEKMIESPLEGPHIKKLRGQHQGKYRYAVGDLRIVYQVDLEQKLILIEAIGPRGDIYK